MATAEAPGGENPKVCLIGFGRWGQNWAKVLNSLGMLSWVVDTDKTRRAKAAYDYPHANVHDKVPMWDLEYMDAAVVATPPEHHRQPTELCLRAGVKVLVEKPMALCPEDAVAMSNTAEDHRQRLMVDHTFLGSRTVMRALDWIPEFVGRPKHIRCVWTNKATDRPEDALWNLGPHPLSVVLTIMRQHNETALASYLVNSVSTHRPGVADAVDMTLIMEDKTLVSIHLSNFAPEKVREFSITGQKGTVVCRPTLEEVIGRPHGGKEQKSMAQERPTPMENVFRTFMDPTPMKDEHGRMGVEVVEALHRISEQVKLIGGAV